MPTIVKIDGQYLCERVTDWRVRKKRFLSSHPFSFQLKRFARMSPSQAKALAQKWNCASLETYRLGAEDEITEKIGPSGMFIINSVENGSEEF